ncbi:ABC transporter substrate-binding protein [Actinocorallia longicatena]|uniref:ABC transporter substrate-binding protein n=1 Tax=Actinocorallia longicatena TaxID=111803 RepID=UPI0031D90DEF
MTALLTVLLPMSALTACSDGRDKATSPPGTPGVTSKPCPNAVNPGNGCIYLGVLTDRSGVFRTIAGPATESQRAFWEKVNRQGGIGGYDINIVTYTRDTKYLVPVFESEFEATKDKVFAYAQLLGSAQVAAVLPKMKAEKIIGAPLSWTSQWAFEDNILESGNSYCFEAMNAVDYAVEAFAAEKKPYKISSVMSVHYAGDYGGDAQGGVRAAAAYHRLGYHHAPLEPGLPQEAIKDVVKQKPSLVVLTTSPADTAAIVEGAVARGFKGRFLGSSPSWSRMLIKDPGKIRSAMESRFWLAGPWRPFATDSPGHAEMRSALGNAGTTNADDSFVSGWAFSFPLRAALEKAAATGVMTRESLFTAARSLTRIDYQGILPKTAGNFSGDANAHAFRESVLSRPDHRQFSGVRVIRDFWEGPTAEHFTLTKPCYTAA